MTEFISRKYGNDGYEVIIKTDCHEHYKASENFARRLIDHEKPTTNADRIRAMSDEELALFLTERYAKKSVLRVREQGYEPTATQIKALHEGLYLTWIRRLQQPAEVES